MADLAITPGYRPGLNPGGPRLYVSINGCDPGPNPAITWVTNPGPAQDFGIKGV